MHVSGAEDLNGRTPFPLVRVVGIWLTLISVESIHGVIRRLFLEPQLGDLRARQVSVFTGAVLIILVFWFTLKWLGPQRPRRWLTFGLLRLALSLGLRSALAGPSGCRGTALPPTSIPGVADCWD